MEAAKDLIDAETLNCSIYDSVIAHACQTASRAPLHGTAHGTKVFSERKWFAGRTMLSHTVKSATMWNDVCEQHAFFA